MGQIRTGWELLNKSNVSKIVHQKRGLGILSLTLGGLATSLSFGHKNERRTKKKRKKKNSISRSYDQKDRLVASPDVRPNEKK